MAALILIAMLFAVPPPDNAPLPNALSPDGKMLATTKIDERYATPEGADFTLYINDRRVYPQKSRHRLFATYTDQHTFRSNLIWSPDGQHIALTEEVYDWEYLDPYNRDFNGYASDKRYFLVVITRGGKSARYPLSANLLGIEPVWRNSATISIGGKDFDLKTVPPGTTP